MTASQRNETWAVILSTGFWRKLTGKRQEFAIPVLHLRRGLCEVLEVDKTVTTCTRLRVTYQFDNVLHASDCVMSARNAGVFRSLLGVRAFRKKYEKQLNSFTAHTTWIKHVMDAIRQQDGDIADVVLSQVGRSVKVQVDERGP